jgi:hypothetical protein
MTKHVSFPSIEQFRNVIRTVQDRARYHNVSLPTITFTGTVKLHGTNAAVCSYVNPKSEIWCQSRSNIITQQSDNAGFAAYVKANKDVFETMIVGVREYFEIFANSTLNNTDVISVFGEWCGQGVQKGVAISQVPKMFVIFAIAIVGKPDESGNQSYRWIEYDTMGVIYNRHLNQHPNSPIKLISNYDTWEIDIDFACPQKVQNQLGKLTEEVEGRCPVGVAFGIEGTGEGIVWKATSCENENFRIDDLIFKVKGEKHSVTRVKTLANVDIEKVNSIKEFVDLVLTEARLSQGIAVMREQGLELAVENTGAFLKWVGSDVIKEESDTMESNGLDRKEVMPVINRDARQWYMKQQLNTI